MPNELSSTKMFVKRVFLSIWVEGISVDEIIAIVFLSQLAGFVIKGLAGFGNPLLTNPLMAMRLDNVVITPTVTARTASRRAAGCATFSPSPRG